jgi:hypothetical protein
LVDPALDAVSAKAAFEVKISEKKRVTASKRLLFLLSTCPPNEEILLKEFVFAT